MNPEIPQVNEIIALSTKADNDQDWEKIDQQIQQLSEVDQNEAALIALKYASHANPQVRDTCASILEFLNISNSSLLKIINSQMIFQAIDDSDIFASGRAATFLLKHQENPDLKAEIEPALEKFFKRAIANNWQEELTANIPNEKLHQLLIKSK